MKNKYRVAFFNKERRQATKPLEIAHSDMCGLIRTTSIGSARYFVTFIDDFFLNVWLYALKSKGNCFVKFKEFKALVKTQLEHKIKTFQSNNNRELVSKAFNHFLKDYGTEKQTCTPYTPQ